MPAATKRKPASKKKKPAEPKAAQDARKQMWVVVTFALGLLLGALIFIKGEKLWRVIHDCLFGVFGWSAWFLPPLVIYAAVVSALDKPFSKIRAKLWQILVLILLISAAVQIFFYELPDSGDFVGNVSRLYADGVSLHGGGAAGLLALPLVNLIGEAGASVVLALSIFVFLMLVTGSTLIGLFRTAAKPVKDLESAYSASLETREQRRQSRAAAEAKRPPKKTGAQPKAVDAAPPPGRGFDFDVDISGDTVLSEDDGEAPWEDTPAAVPAAANMPAHPVFSDIPFIPPDVSGPEPAADFMKSPVEYISPEEFAPPRYGEQLAEIDTERRRLSLLEQDILEAEKNIPAQRLDDKLDSLGLRAGEPSAEDEAFGFDAAGPLEDFEEQQNPVAPEVISLPAFGAAVEPPRFYRRPPLNLLKNQPAANTGDITQELNQNAQTLVDTLKSFGVETRITAVTRGPAVTRYELQPSAGVKINRITNLADDIALNLAAAGIRIEAPIPGKPAVGIEVPNKVVNIVSIRELLDSEEFRKAESSVTVALGRDITGHVVLADVFKMPHALIAGSTGAGKSVCINSIIISLLYKSSPEDVKLLMIDPKVVELGVYNGIPHLLVPVVTDPKKAAGALNWAVAEMERRYREFFEYGVRDLAGYNRLAAKKTAVASEMKPMPQIVIIIDELADLLMVSPKELEDSISRLAAKARAAGMHLIVATQRPTADVLTGTIKANIPSRIAFKVPDQINSRTILDMGGAEKLLGRGDMLFFPMGAAKPMRVQGCFVTDGEVEEVVKYIKAGEDAEYDARISEEIERLVIPDKNNKDGGGFDNDDDEMLPQAIECVVEAGMASTSMLQKKLRLGYARASRIIDQLEERGVVGPFEGSKPRQVLISHDRYLEMKLRGE